MTLSISLLLIFHHLLDRWACRQSLQPLLIIRISFPIDLNWASSKRCNGCPSHEAEIGIGAFIADEIFFAFQGGVEDAGDTLDFFAVTLDC